MAEVVEQKPIGIPIGTDGTFSNTEFKNGAIQIKASSQEPLEYYPVGLWTSNIVNIGDSFKDFGKIILTVTNKNGSKVEISTRTSADGVSFSTWQKTTEDGSIISPKNKFLQVRLTLYAGTTISKIDIANDEYIGNNEFVESVIYKESAPIVPVLTSDTSSANGVAFSSSNAGSAYLAWKAFDRLDTTYMRTGSGQTTGQVGFLFNTPQKIYKYTVGNYTPMNNIMATGWELQASNDTTTGLDGSWVVLDTQTAQSWGTTATVKEYSIANQTEYKAYRLNLTSNTGGATIGIGELNFIVPSVESIQLKRDYKFDMTQDSTWSDTGSLHKKDIVGDEWLKIDKLEASDIDSKPPVKIDVATMSDSSVITNDNTIEKGVARADTPRNKGKVYFEGKYLSDNYNIIGICLREFNPKTYIMSSLSPSINMWTFENARGIMQYDNKFNNPYTTGTTILSTVGVGVDLDLGKLEFFVNGVSKGIAPVSIPTGKDIFPLIGLATGGKATLNFGATPFEYGLPTGYEAWQENEINKTFILHDGEYKKYQEKKNDTENKIPIMTSNTTPSGVAFASSEYDSSYAPWKAFNGTNLSSADSWSSTYTDGNSGNSYIGYDFQKNVVINKLVIQSKIGSANQFNTSLVSFNIEGWNGVNWIVLEENCNLGTWTNQGEIKEYKFNNTSPFSKYRLNKLTSIASGYGVSIPVLEMHEITKDNGDDYGFLVVSSTLPTSTQFLEQGMDSLSPLLDRKVTTLESMNMIDKSEILNGEIGKVFSKTIDLNKYFDIRSIRTEGK